MPRHRLVVATFIASVGLTACAGLRDALTAHVDIAARAGSQELSVTRLAEMLSSANVPPRKDVALAIANLWVNYELLGEAAAKGDTLADPAVVDDAMWAQIAQAKSGKFFDQIKKTFPALDSSSFEKRYNDGDMLAARHILFMAQKNVMQQPQRDSVRRVAEKVAKMVTPANFAAMARKYSMDGSKSQGGDLGVFPKGAMVPEFEKGVLALKPGQVSGVVESPFGYHIIMRETWPEAKAKFVEAYGKIAEQSAESTYLAAAEKGAAVEVKSGAAKTVKAIAEDVDGYRDDKTVLATSRSGDLTAARMARWIAAFPPQQRIREQIGQAPDSAIPYLVRNVMRNELVLHAADSAKIVLDSTDVKGIRGAFIGSVTNAMNGLHIAPAQLADSAKSTSERERLAASRIETYLDLLLKNQVQFVNVSEPVALALRKKFEARVVTAGIDRAVAEAGKLKAKADSARSKALPSSVVPMPGAPAAPAAAAPAPTAAAPATKTEPAKPAAATKKP